MSNILLNRSFETGSIDNWTFLTGSIAKSSGQAYDGTYSCKLTDPTTSYSGRAIESDQVAAIVGKIYTAGVWVYIEDTGSGVPSSSLATHIRMRLKFYDSSHVFLSYGYYDLLNPLWGYTDIAVWDSWVYKEFDFTAPASTAYVSILLEGREKNDPSPHNNIYFDYAIIDEAAPLYAEDDQRIVGAIGLHHDADDYRIYGYIMGPMPSNDSFRIYGLIAEHASTSNYLIVGEITYRMEYLEDPDSVFLAKEDQLCNSPQNKVFLFHDDFPVNPVSGPPLEGSNYIDITDRVIGINSISRDLQTTPSDQPALTISDLAISLDNSDDYFSVRNPACPYYDIPDYTGWTGGGRVEVWTGFKTSNNTIKLIKKAKMVIVSLKTDSSTGTATLNLKDRSANVFDKIVGVPDGDKERPLEYPTRDFTHDTDDFLLFQTDLIGWTKINMLPSGHRWMGKHTQAILMTEAMNASALVTGAGNNPEVFSVTFDEEAQVYTFSGTNIDYLQIDAGACIHSDLFSFDPFKIPSAIYGAGAGSGQTEIIGDKPLTLTIDFQTCMENLLLYDGGIDPAYVDIEAVPSVTFATARWDNVSLSQAISEVAICGVGSLWMDEDGLVKFRTFPNMPSEVAKVIRGDTNYQTAEYADKDASRLPKKITVTGKFGIKSEYDSGLDIGSEYVISSNIIDLQTVADDMVAGYYSYFSATPQVLNIKGEYLPSLGLGDRLEIHLPDNDTPIFGQVVTSGLDPIMLTHNVSVIPYSYIKTWSTKDDWDDFDAEDVTQRLCVPHDMDYLQIKLTEYSAGYRDYIFDCDPADPAAQARWLNFIYSADLTHKKIFIDHLDESPYSRYTVISPEFNKGYSNGPAGGWNYYGNIIIIDSMGEDSETFLIINDLFDAAPVYYLNYEIATQFRITDIFGVNINTWKVSDSHALLHYYGMIVRWFDNLNMDFSFSRAVGGASGSKLGRISGGVIQYSSDHASPADYIPFNAWLDGSLGVESNVFKYNIPGYADLSDTAAPMFDPWNGPAQTGFGFARCKGEISQIEVSSIYAPDATDPTFGFYTSDDDITYTYQGTDISLCPESKYIKIRVTMSRVNQYATIPFLKSMTIGYSK